MRRTVSWLAFILFAFLLLGAASVTPVLTPDVRPRVLVVVAPEAFQESEWRAVSAALGRRARLIVASTRPGTARGMSGGSLPVAVTLDRVRPEAFDLVVLLGGSGAKTHLWFDPGVHALVRGAHRLRRPLAAIDVAPAALAAAGVLTGRTATVLPGPEALKLFERHGVTYRAQEVVVDRDLVTAAGASASASWASALVHLLPKRSRASAPRARPSHPIRSPYPSRE